MSSPPEIIWGTEVAVFVRVEEDARRPVEEDDNPEDARRPVEEDDNPEDARRPVEDDDPEDAQRPVEDVDPEGQPPGEDIVPQERQIIQFDDRNVGGIPNPPQENADIAIPNLPREDDSNIGAIPNAICIQCPDQRCQCEIVPDHRSPPRRIWRNQVMSDYDSSDDSAETVNSDIEDISDPM